MQPAKHTQYCNDRTSHRIKVARTGSCTALSLAAQGKPDVR